MPNVVLAETHRRSFAKVISWRTTATLTTVLISYGITGSFDLALKIGGVEMVAKMVLQYFHERLWTVIKFGLKQEPIDYQI
ncbi:DUF2061 domain-containing protein [bacterium]|nr:DUF2061 domain-containing protein [bacterium]